MSKYLKNFRRGDTKLIRVDYDTDITGWTFWFTLRKEFADAAFVLQIKTNPGDHALDDPAAGIVHFEIQSDASKTLEPYDYVWDIQVSKGGTPPDITTILPPVEDVRDRLTVLYDVTQVDS